MQKHVSGSIRHLAAAAQRISHEPDLTVRVEPSTNDEIGDLYCAFNAMMDRLQERERERDLAYTELDSIRAQLEDRVALRTEQYRAANEALEREFERLRAAEAEISRALAEKETLLREIHHRVKNNLQVVHSLLSLQIKPGEERDAAALLEDARQRVKTIAVVHETLYRSDNLANVSGAHFLKQIADNVARIFTGGSRIRVISAVDDVRLDADQAIPVGLIVNELVTNAFKYAFAPEEPGTIRLRLQQGESDQLLLEVSDDGRGLPEGLEFGKATSLGWMLVRALVQQLRGDIALDSSSRGTKLTIRFPGA
jgi:two-component sensor histidine kinase